MHFTQGTLPKSKSAAGHSPQASSIKVAAAKPGIGKPRGVVMKLVSNLLLRLLKTKPLQRPLKTPPGLPKAPAKQNGVYPHGV